MAIFRRLAIIGAAAGAAAYFLKQRQEADSGTGPASFEPEAVGDAAVAGTGTSQEQPKPPEPEAQQAAPAPEQATRVAEVVKPDTSADDPAVREEESAAAAEAGSIGGTPETPAADTGLARDPAMKPVVEASGEEHETLEDADRDLGAGRERQG